MEASVNLIGGRCSCQGFPTCGSCPYIHVICVHKVCLVFKKKVRPFMMNVIII